MAAPAAPRFWGVLELTSSGRPKLREGEVEYLLQPKLELEPERVHGCLTLTSHRLLWTTDGAPDDRRAASLAAVTSVRMLAPKHMFSKTRRIEIAIGAAPGALVLAFRHGGEDEALAAMQSALERKTWDVPVTAQRGQGTGGFSASRAGIAGLVRKREKEQRTEGKLASEAFADLEALMRKAKDVVAVMERYKAALAAAAAQDQPGADGHEARQLNDLLLNIGISSPVTKASAGTLYHQQLARQLADFLLDGGQLEQAGGMMTLPDVYCIFNRARGLELISPDDLHAVTKLLGPLRLAMSVRTFDSGVTVIQADSHDDEAMARWLADAARDAGCVTFTAVANKLGIPLPLAKEHVLMAEQRGLLCRDECMEHTRFFPNRFDEFACGLGG